MIITPSQFAAYLLDSTLEPSEKEAIMKLLPGLTFAQIQGIGAVLKHDVDTQEDILRKAQLKTDTLLQKLEKVSGGGSES